ncbi:MAG: Gfo/Idh/MocA family oxidoreductase [Clostridia bacterium]|nr:Gfo/Idh/MocA family oxidoreductase [Clostridia bacterium]
MSKLRIGIVGAGNIAVNAHLPAYQAVDNVDIVAIADLNLERAKEAAERFSIPAYFGSVEEMLENVELDAVDICTWNNGHAPVCIAAAKAGKHIVCEKPMASDLASAKAMEAAVKEAGVTFMLAVPGRFNVQNMAVRELMEAGELGDVYYAKVANVRRRGTPTGWFTDKKTSGGGPVIDIGVHSIDAAWYLMGNPKPTRVSAQVWAPHGDYQTKGVGRWQGTPCPDNQFDCEDSGAGIIHFENGAAMLFEATWAFNAPSHTDVQVVGSKAGVTLDPLTVYGERASYLSDDVITVGENDHFAEELRHFASCVLEDKPTKYPPEQAVQMQEMLQAIYDSAAEGREITL